MVEGREAMAWGRDQDHRFIAPFGGLHRMGVFGVADHAEVDGALFDHAVDFVRMCQLVVQVGGGALACELFLQRWEVRESHRIDRCDDDVAGDTDGGVAAEADFVDQRIELPEDAREAVEELLAFGGEDEGAFGAIDEFDAEEFFEVLDALASSALRHAMFDGCVRKTSLAHDVVEHF